MSSQLSFSNGSSLLPIIFTARPDARKRLRDFFSSHIRNRNTRRAYMEAVRQFEAFCAGNGIGELDQVEAVHVAAFVEHQLQMNSRPTVKLRRFPLTRRNGIPKRVNARSSELSSVSSHRQRNSSVVKTLKQLID